MDEKLKAELETVYNSIVAEDYLAAIELLSEILERKEK